MSAIIELVGIILGARWFWILVSGMGLGTILYLFNRELEKIGEHLEHIRVELKDIGDAIRGFRQ